LIKLERDTRYLDNFLELFSIRIDYKKGRGHPDEKKFYKDAELVGNLNKKMKILKKKRLVELGSINPESQNMKNENLKVIC
jgi:hypothetical protein